MKTLLLSFIPGTAFGVLADSFFPTISSHGFIYMIIVGMALYLLFIKVLNLIMNNNETSIKFQS